MEILFILVGIFLGLLWEIFKVIYRVPNSGRKTPANNYPSSFHDYGYALTSGTDDSIDWDDDDDDDDDNNRWDYWDEDNRWDYWDEPDEPDEPSYDDCEFDSYRSLDAETRYNIDTDDLEAWNELFGDNHDY